MNSKLWDEWIKNLKWIHEIAKKRGWDYDDIVIKEPLYEKQVEELETKLNIKYPTDFKKILTEYSSGIHFSWQMRGEKANGEYRGVFCGGGDGYLWNFESLEELYKDYISWVENCFPNIEDEYDKIWHNKIPFLHVPNGDFIVFDVVEPMETSPIIYLSHEGDDFHGSCLANSFIEFITKWTNIGCVGTEDWQLEVFYDVDNKTLKGEGLIIDHWKQWLEVEKE